MSTTATSVRSSSSSASSRSSDGLPFPRPPGSSSEFEVEHMSSKASSTSSSRKRRQSSDRDCEAALRACVSLLIGAKTRSFAVSGKIPIDPSTLILFFRSKVSLLWNIPRYVELIEIRLGWDHTFSRLPYRHRLRHAAINGRPHLAQQTTLSVRA